MTKYEIHSDRHMKDFEAVMEFMREPFLNLDPSTIKVYLGDNLDYSGMPQEQLDNLRSHLTHDPREYFRKIFNVYVSGNHELQHTDVYYKLNDIVFTHGDMVSWGFKKATKYRNKQAGASFLKRLFSPFILRDRSISHLPEKDEKRAKLILEHFGCRTLVMGHYHPKTIVDCKYKWGRVIIVPRGITEVEI